VCTDPPYYDNVGYADLSDFFFVWLRRHLAGTYPDLFSTLLTPKSQELVATPYRFDGSKARAKEFFESGLGHSFELLRAAQDPSYPMCLFYAFRESETNAGGEVSASTGWETMLEGLFSAGFTVTGTWPMRSEGGTRLIAMGTNALASSIVLVCRQRPEAAAVATRREFLQALRAELPGALRILQHGNIAPVDLAQAAIGPGIAVFSRYAKVVEASGEKMPVRTALGLINQVLDEVITEQESEFDPATRFAIAWFETRGLDRGRYGEAEVLAKAKGTTPETVAREGFLEAKGGKVRLLHWSDLPEGWDPTTDRRLTYWEATHYLIRAHQQEGTGSEQAATELLRRMRGYGEIARDLAYRLYVTCERKGWAELALPYNALVVAWPEITRLADAQAPEQTTLGG
jgi:putative DNA methylase